MDEFQGDLMSEYIFQTYIDDVDRSSDVLQQSTEAFEYDFDNGMYLEDEPQLANRLNRIFPSIAVSEYGAEIGKDFSSLDGSSYLLSQHLVDRMTIDSSSEHKGHFQSLLSKKIEINPFDAVDNMLGCNFFDNLVRVGSARVRRLSAIDTALYVTHLSAGILDRHPYLNLDDEEYSFRGWMSYNFCDRNVKRMMKVYSVMPAQEAGYYRDPSTVKLQVWHDILAAMGIKVKMSGSELYFSADDLRAIGQVWRDPESPISLRELADRLDKETGNENTSRR